MWAKDTPNFIGNRIGTFSVLNLMRLMQEMDLSVEEVDGLTGQAVGWPRSGTFRTIELVGLDIVGLVAGNMAEFGGGRESPASLALPDFVHQMLERRWLGDKSGGGFYKKARGGDGPEGERLALDWKTLEYRPRQKPKFPALEMAKNVEDLGARVRMLLGFEGEWAAKSETRRASSCGRLSGRFVDLIPPIGFPRFRIPWWKLDRAMRLGFNWELGPFGLWDAAGVKATVERMKKEGRTVAANVEKLLAAGRQSWYDRTIRRPHPGQAYFDLRSAGYKAVEVPAGVWSVAVAKKSHGVVEDEFRGFCSSIWATEWVRSNSIPR